MKLYLAGPMTGYKDHNYPLFFRVAAELRIAGYEVANPAEIRPLAVARNLTRALILREDVSLLVTCDTIALLPDWPVSQGARLEHEVAVNCGLAIKHVTHLLGWSESLLRGEKL